MKRVRIPGTDLEVSALCYGLGSFGTSVRGEEADRLYAAYRESGGCFFDTAHCYSFWVEGGLGAGERALGECLRRHGDRAEVVIATKGGHPDAGPGYRRPDRYLAPEVIASDITESLDRLRVDAIDLYYLHRDDPRVPVREILGALNAEIARGRGRHLGASNWPTARIAGANDHAKARGLRGFVASQPQWSLAHSNAEPPKSDPATRFLMDEDVRWHATQEMVFVHGPRVLRHERPGRQGCLRQPHHPRPAGAGTTPRLSARLHARAGRPGPPDVPELPSHPGPGHAESSPSRRGSRSRPGGTHPGAGPLASRVT